MKPHSPLARDVIDVVGEYLKIPVSFVRQISNNLKNADRLPKGSGPIAPPVTARDIARLIVGCAAPAVKDAVKFERRASALPLFSGVGQSYVEIELADMLAVAAGIRNGEISFRGANMLVGNDGRSVYLNNSVYRDREELPAGLDRIASIPHTAIAQIARTLLPTEDYENGR